MAAPAALLPGYLMAAPAAQIGRPSGARSRWGMIQRPRAPLRFALAPGYLMAAPAALLTIIALAHAATSWPRLRRCS
jgi:hypothetical protein